jgi:hypothetical protein
VFLVFQDRPSDSPFIERVWRCHSERAGLFHSIASPHWEMAVTRHRGRTYLTIRGPETKATMADCPADGEWLGIRFRLGTFMPKLPVSRLIDRQDVDLPSLSDHSFWFEDDVWEYPSFENAESFVARLVKNGFVTRDGAVQAALAGDLALHPAAFPYGDRHDAGDVLPDRACAPCHAASQARRVHSRHRP